jgi:hypothetical protein
VADVGNVVVLKKKKKSGLRERERRKIRDKRTKKREK